MVMYWYYSSAQVALHALDYNYVSSFITVTNLGIRLMKTDILVFLMPEQLKLLATNSPERSKGELVSQ